MRDGKKLLSLKLSAMGPVPAQLPRPQPAYFRARYPHEPRKWRLHQRVHRRCTVANPFTTLPVWTKFLILISSGASNRWRNSGFSARSPVHPTRSLPCTIGSPAMPYDQVCTGWAYPPKDLQKMGPIWFTPGSNTRVGRYGKAEVESLVPGTLERAQHRLLGKARWRNIASCSTTPPMVPAKRALPTIRMGGPETTGPSWNKAADFLKTFLTHCVSGKSYASWENWGAA